ncbi:MAG TPA: hypothetical protein VFE08_14460 [Candidatus Sulfotelmatobacter sp.]|nr:hypothetical protein [Candidatus Sulfotelmatobacter sp.]
MEKYTHGLVPSKGMLRYRADAECDLDHALRLDMTDEEYVITVLMEGDN